MYTLLICCQGAPKKFTLRKMRRKVDKKAKKESQKTAINKKQKKNDKQWEEESRIPLEFQDSYYQLDEMNPGYYYLVCEESVSTRDISPEDSFFLEPDYVKRRNYLYHIGGITALYILSNRECLQV